MKTQEQLHRDVIQRMTNRAKAHTELKKAAEALLLSEPALGDGIVVSVSAYTRLLAAMTEVQKVG